MGYFSNGEEGLRYQEQYCIKCLHFETCPILLMHMLWNYDAVGSNADKTKAEALGFFIPRSKDGLSNEKCLMWTEDKSDKWPILSETQELVKLRAWNDGRGLKS